MDLSREITLIQKIGDETEYKEDITAMFDHGMIVAMLTEIMAKGLKLSENVISDIAKAGMLHDIGKLRLSAYLYGRNNSLMDIDEIKYARMHPVLSRDIVTEAGIYNENIIKYIYYHHENNDGTGYPERLIGENTPLGAKILHVCDTFISLVSERPFRSAYDKETALSIMALESDNYDMALYMRLIDIVFSEDYDRLEDFIRQANERYLSQNS
jgi:HD-GYP domain-containing protein (c-di-GMP phosphodiesterase class II)